MRISLEHLHCPYCYTCFDGYGEYIEHFRVDGRLMFASCPDMEKAE